LDFQEGALQFVTNYGYIALFLALILGLVGLPVPDEILLTYAGFLIAQGRLELIPTVIVCAIGSILGMSMSYYIGLKLGTPFLLKYKKLTRITPKRLDHIQSWFERFGKLAVTFGYFFPGIRHFSAYTAGISKWDFKSFVGYALLGGMIWTLFFISVGVFLKDQWELILQLTHQLGISIVFSLLIAIVFYNVFKKYLKASPK
jgi:membrane protein DedA with SNARE-associated domain